jgi:hypothetical protein
MLLFVGCCAMCDQGAASMLYGKPPLISQNAAIDFVDDIYFSLTCHKTGDFCTRL